MVWLCTSAKLLNIHTLEKDQHYLRGYREITSRKTVNICHRNINKLFSMATIDCPPSQAVDKNYL